MKKSLLALAVLGAFAGVASAQSAVTVYGEVDLGLYKDNSTGNTLAMKNGDNSRLGFKGSEDLGGGLSAIFKAEIRFDADTGTNEGGTRPLFQGRSYVGLAGGFGTIRLGRDLTAFQSASGNFDAWGALRARPGFDPFQDGSYVSVTNNGSGNRFSNALLYTTPTMSGFSGGLTLAAKESSDLSVGEIANNTPVSVAGSYSNGPVGAMLGYEKSLIGSKIWKIGGSYNFGPANLIGTYAKNSTLAPNSDVKTWHFSSAIPMGAEKFLVGYGQQKPDVGVKNKLFSLGFEHTLSKRTFVYVDLFNAKAVTSVSGLDLGINHTF